MKKKPREPKWAASVAALIVLASLDLNLMVRLNPDEPMQVPPGMEEFLATSDQLQ